jgi:zinc protease
MSLLNYLFYPFFHRRWVINLCSLSLGLLLLGHSLPTTASIQIQEFNTSKNIHVIFVADKSSPTDLTTVQFSFKGMGSSADPVGKEGLSAIMTELLLNQGKEGLDQLSLNKKLKKLGVLYSINSSVDSDNITFNFKAPTTKLKEVFEIIQSIMVNPIFDSKELDKLKSFDPPGSRLASASEIAFATKILIQQLFAGSPYENPAYGTLDGRQSITLTDLQQAAKERFVRSALVFSVVGNLSEKTLGDHIDATLGGLPQTSQLQPLPKIKLVLEGKTTIIPKDSPQSGVVFGQQGLSPLDPDFLPFLILNDTLGGKAFTSRLWLEAREKRGLVYNIQTEIFQWKQASVLSGQFETENQKVQEVVDLIRTEWDQLREKGMTEEEFNASKKGLLGGFALNFTSPDGIASYLLGCYLSDIPADYINQRNLRLNQITLQDVNRVAQQYLDPKNLSFVIVGNPPETDFSKENSVERGGKSSISIP